MTDVPILEVIAGALPAATESRVELAQHILGRLREHNRDPDVLWEQLQSLSTAAGNRSLKITSLENANAAHLTEIQELHSDLAQEEARSEAHAGSTRILESFLANEMPERSAVEASVSAARAIDPLPEPVDG